MRANTTWNVYCLATLSALMLLSVGAHSCILLREGGADIRARPLLVDRSIIGTLFLCEIVAIFLCAGMQTRECVADAVVVRSACVVATHVLWVYIEPVTPNYLILAAMHGDGRAANVILVAGFVSLLAFFVQLAGGKYRAHGPRSMAYCVASGIAWYLAGVSGMLFPRVD